MKRVVVTGSECTGKTTLAEHLAACFNTVWVPEYSREYAARRGGLLDDSDVEPIARGQLSLEEEYLAQAHDILVLDTDMISTVVYSNHYYGHCPSWIENECRRRMASLYLLLHPDVPWLADGIRDRGESRAEMHELFRNALERFSARFVDITGDWTIREKKAIEAVKMVLE